MAFRFSLYEPQCAFSTDILVGFLDAKIHKLEGNSVLFRAALAVRAICHCSGRTSFVWTWRSDASNPVSSSSAPGRAAL